MWLQFFLGGQAEAVEGDVEHRISRRAELYGNESRMAALIGNEDRRASLVGNEGRRVNIIGN